MTRPYWTYVIEDDGKQKLVNLNTYRPQKLHPHWTGEQLRKWRKDQGWSQAKCAWQLGIWLRQLVLWERYPDEHLPLNCLDNVGNPPPPLPEELPPSAWPRQLPGRARLKSIPGYGPEFCFNWRKRHSLTIREAAEIIHVTSAVIVNWESNKTAIPKGAIDIMESYNRRMDHLSTGE